MSVELLLARALIDAILFIEFSSEAVLDEDAGVRQLESLASILGDLDDISRERFVSLCQEVSRDYGESREKAAYVRNIPSSFGIVD